MTSFNARSSTINSTSVAGEGRYAINGFPLTAARSGGFSSYVYDTVNTEEIAITVGGGLGESDIGGPVMNIIPRSGGNQFAGTGFFSNAGEWSSGDNLSSDIQALNPNLRPNPGVVTAYDWSASLRRSDQARSPLVLRQLSRPQHVGLPMDGILANANAGDPARWDWVGSPIEARLVQDRTMWIGRMTGQFGKHRVRVNSEYQHRCEGTPLEVESRGLPQSRRGLDRPRQQPGADADVAGSDVDCGPRLLRRAVLREPGHVDDGGEQQAAVRSGLHGVPLSADLRPSGARRQHQPDSGDGAVERDQRG